MLPFFHASVCGATSICPHSPAVLEQVEFCWGNRCIWNLSGLIQKAKFLIHTMYLSKVSWKSATQLDGYTKDPTCELQRQQGKKRDEVGLVPAGICFHRKWWLLQLTAHWLQLASCLVPKSWATHENVCILLNKRYLYHSITVSCYSLNMECVFLLNTITHLHLDSAESDASLGFHP